MQGNRKEASKEYIVAAQDIQNLFQAPIGRSTFYSLIRKGVVAQCPRVKGRYLLNKTRSNLGLPPVEQYENQGNN